jgi:hypothetical protein
MNNSPFTPTKNPFKTPNAVPDVQPPTYQEICEAMQIVKAAATSLRYNEQTTRSFDLKLEAAVATLNRVLHTDFTFETPVEAVTDLNGFSGVKAGTRGVVLSVDFKASHPIKVGWENGSVTQVTDNQIRIR